MKHTAELGSQLVTVINEECFEIKCESIGIRNLTILANTVPLVYGKVHTGGQVTLQRQTWRIGMLVDGLEYQEPVSIKNGVLILVKKNGVLILTKGSLLDFFCRRISVADFEEMSEVDGSVAVAFCLWRNPHLSVDSLGAATKAIYEELAERSESVSQR